MGRRVAGHGAGAPSLADLPALDRRALETLWRQLYGLAPPKRLGHGLLLRAVAYQLQVKAHGGLAAPLQRRLRQIAASVDATGHVPGPARARIKPGTRLLRVWQGRTHEVEVVADGFLWQGQRHRSLSVIARTITGTRWSGPAFFGLGKAR